MIVSQQHLANLLLQNVCEIRFNRRRIAAGKSAMRRMLCTKSFDLLNSLNGRVALNYRPPHGGMQINEAAKNVLVVWDILMQDYRIVSMDSCDLLKTLPADESFWKYYNESLLPMRADQKLAFMNS